MAKKILIIEDEVALANNLKVALKKKYKIYIASLGKEGLKIAQEKKPDLILLDLILPDIFGLEILKELKADIETQKIPVVILSCLGDTPNISRAIKIGCQSYIVKADFSLDEVIQKIKEIIG